MKTVKSRSFKKYLKRRKSRAWFCLSLGWLNISEKNFLLKTTILLVQDRKVGKGVSLWPNFDPNFRDI